MATYGVPVSSHGYRRRGGNDLLKMLMSLVDSGDSGYQEARQANESRYQDTLKLLADGRTRTLDNLNEFGDSLVNDANRNYDNLRNNLISDLADRGLSGSTKRIAVENSSRRERDAAVNRIKDTLLENRAAADERWTDKAAGVMERREDPYPENRMNVVGLVGQLAQLGLLDGGGGGELGSLGGLLGGGGSGRPRSLPGRGRRGIPAVIEQPAPPKYGPHREYDGSQWESQQELSRRRALSALSAAMAGDGVEYADRQRQALAYLQENGWAEQNPNSGTPQVSFARTSATDMSGPIYAGGGGRTPNYNPAYAADRRNYQNQTAIKNRQRHLAMSPAGRGAVAGGAAAGNAMAGLSNLGLSNLLGLLL